MSYYPSHGSGPEGHRGTETAGDPAARPGRGTDGRRDRRGVRGQQSGDLAAPERAEGGGARVRATRRDAAVLPRATGEDQGVAAVPGGVLADRTRPLEGCGRVGREEEAP